MFGLITLVLALAGFAAIFAAISSGNFTLLYVMAVLLGVVFLLLILIQAALQGVYSAALYRFASEGDAGQGFDKAVVADAFYVPGERLRFGTRDSGHGTRDTGLKRMRLIACLPSPPRGEGVKEMGHRAMPPDGLQHSIGAQQNVIIPKTQYYKTLR